MLFVTRFSPQRPVAHNSLPTLENGVICHKDRKIINKGGGVGDRMRKVITQRYLQLNRRSHH